MDTTPFYELKNRLYASAAAGCGSISEDFRLKRAVESFEPLSKANKAFGKLYGLCGSLLKSENPETEIPDCIALADALSITQGIYRDDSETEPVCKYDTGRAEIPYSELENLCADIRKNVAKLWQLPKDKACFLKEPRVLHAVLDNLENGKETPAFELFMNIVCRVYGDGLADILKASGKTSGKQIKYIENLRGYKENDWYLSLYENAENSDNVRKEAVLALSCSESNTEKLLEIYKTEKGKIKNAAVMALAKLSPKEAEPVFAKMAAKYKYNFEDYFSESCGEVCTKFVIDRIMDKFGQDKPAGSVSVSDPHPQLYPQTIERLLHNKTGVDADGAYLTLSSSAKKNLTIYDLTLALNYSLTYSLSNPKKREEAKAQITRLYNQDSEYFRQSKAFLNITENPEAPVPFDPKTYDSVFEVINSIHYIPMLDQYFLQPVFQQYRVVLPSLDFLAGERLPKPMLDFLVKMSEYLVEDLREMENSKDEGMLKIPKDGKPSKTQHINKRFFNARKYTWDVIHLLKELLKVGSPLDCEAIKNTMKSLAVKITEVCGNELSFSIVAKHCGEISADEKIRLHTAYILNNLKYTGTYSYVCEGITDFSHEDQLKAVKHLYGEFKKLSEKVKSENWFVNENGFLRQEEIIRGAIVFLEKPR